MDRECEYCGALYHPVGGVDDSIIEAPYCECDLEKKLEKINNPSVKPYKNHCWNCKSKIDSRVCEKDTVQGHGFICKKCGQSLRNLK
ncbi:MAG: hypothetical protein LJE96_09855 [Deltaproteobacteria bacterium]|nr:hypothetical protein [Deltaproteobacteria bacterium]